MLKYLRYLIVLVAALCLLVMAFANRAAVTVKALPDDMAALWGRNWQVDLPLFLVILGGVVAGLLIGFIWEWLREHRHRATASSQATEARRLQRELAAMRDAKGQVQQDDVLVLIEKKKG
jgi:uncharacterized integral membrane protein